MFAEAAVPHAETALKQPLVFAPWASAASEEGVCVWRAAAVQQRRFLTLPGTDLRNSSLRLCRCFSPSK